TERFLWEAGFCLSCGRKAAVRDDVNYAMGSAIRTVCAWTQVLFALNGRYQMNEKGSLAAADRMPTAPVRLEARVGEACREIAAGRGGTAWRILEDLHAEIGILAAP
ncbi:MAG: hypothetical protein KBA30_06745, partial [Clostridia bacterium]|nr:hypothetical protein [Clostridia bacterium]